LSLESIFIALTLLVVISIVLYTIRIGISPMPSSARSREAILSLLDDCDGSRLVELGSGWGNLLIPIARRYPDKEIVAYELSPFPYLVSVFLKFLFRLHNVRLLRRDFLCADLSEADVLVCYLYPGGMKQLQKKILSDGLSPTVISNTFAFDGIEPQRVLRVNDLYNSPVYLYKLG
jgi:hypothetical protein